MTSEAQQVLAYRRQDLLLSSVLLLAHDADCLSLCTKQALTKAFLTILFLRQLLISGPQSA